MMKWRRASHSRVIPGISHLRNGSTKREVCTEDMASVEAVKIQAIQMNAGSQRFIKSWERIGVGEKGVIWRGTAAEG